MAARTPRPGTWLVFGLRLGSGLGLGLGLGLGFGVRSGVGLAVHLQLGLLFATAIVSIAIVSRVV